MNVIRRILPNRWHKGFTIVDYFLAAVSDPRLVGEAARHVLTRRSRKVESGLRAARRPELREPASRSVVPASLEATLERLAQDVHVLVLDRHPERMNIGVADVDLLSALVRLTTIAPGVSLSIDGEPVNFGSPHFKSRALDAKRIYAALVDQNFDLARFAIESYRRTAPGRWISTNDRNAVARAVYGDLFERPGITEARALIGGRTLGQVAEDRPVDVVYTWVNHADPDWQALYAAAGAPEKEKRDEAVSVDAETFPRFHNKDELRYSLRSVALNLPWVKRIHVFTNCARPEWLKPDDPRLVWVRHEDVVPSEYLPTFNSHVIESYLHRIPDLSEHFIYLNDDVFVMKRLEKNHFFNENGTSRSVFEKYAMVSGDVRPGDADYLNASRNSARLVARRFGHVPTQLHKHVAFALRRSTLAAIEADFADAFAGFRGNRFRRSNDVNLTSFLYHHYAIATGEATTADYESRLVKPHDVRWRTHLAQVAKKPPQILCINDGGDMRPSAIWESSVREFMETHFPKEATWET